MKYLIPFFLLVMLNPLKSQSFWLKGYVGIQRAPMLELSRFPDPQYIFVNEQSSTALIAMPAIALQLKERDFWELGASWKKIQYNNVSAVVAVPPSDSLQSLGIGSTKYRSLTVQIEYNYCFTKNPENRWQTFVGIGLSPRWARFDFTSSQSYIYSSDHDIKGADLGLVPRVQYKWKNNLSFDANISIGVLTGQYNVSARRNPALTKRQQESRVFEAHYFGGYMLRAGLAWKIWNKKIETHANF